jgi:glutamyl-tRNA reductase
VVNKLEGIFVYDIDDLQQVAAAHIAERSKEATNAEALIEAEVERFHERQRTVNVAPAIVALQRQAEEIRQAELRRAQARLGSLSEEQTAAVEALTRGLVNKFLHPPMHALKQAARENDSTRLEALCETWSLPAGNGSEAAPESAADTAGPKLGEPEKEEGTTAAESNEVAPR